MKKITIIFILSLLLSSCSNNTIDETKNEVLTNSGNIMQEEIIEEVFENDSSVELEKLSFDSYSLKGSIGKDIEKVEIVWQNGDKEDSYLLKKYEKGSENFLSNLKFSYGNLGIGTNKYIIKGYIGDEVIEEKEYTFNIANNGCEVELTYILNKPTDMQIYKGIKDTREKSDIELFCNSDEVIKVNFSFPGNCKEKIVERIFYTQYQKELENNILLQTSYVNNNNSTLINDEEATGKNINGYNYKIELNTVYNFYDNKDNYFYKGILKTPNKILESTIFVLDSEKYQVLEMMNQIFTTFTEIENKGFDSSDYDINNSLLIDNAILLMDNNYGCKKIKTGNSEISSLYMDNMYDFTQLNGNILTLEGTTVLDRYDNINEDYVFDINIDTGEVIQKSYKQWIGN